MLKQFSLKGQRYKFIPEGERYTHRGEREETTYEHMHA
jgi:hypothetical protein